MALQTLRVPESAVREFNEVERMDWSDGVDLTALVKWINGVAVRFLPAERRSRGSRGTRASRAFTPRTFRHYQTLGCIDAPERVGKHAVYRFRQYVQALVVRKLIWERLPSERIAAIMSGRSTAELKQLLFEGIEIVPRHAEAVPQPPSPEGETWTRISVIQGLELHLRADLPRPRPRELKEWLARMDAALRARL